MAGNEQREIRFGVIGAGLMAREFVSAAARWCHLLGMDARPRVVAVASATPKSLEWFRGAVPDLALATNDYREILGRDDVDAVYIAVPHHLHEQVFVDTIRAGKHVFGEKPFGIDAEANAHIMDELAAHPQVFARCVSQQVFIPGAQRIIRYLREERFGRIIDVEAGFWHSSDLNPLKPINWKRQVQYNGEYGCMGDLGMHVLHIPLRFGWMPRSVRGLLSKVVDERPDANGQMVPCDTWDNAILACEVETGGQQFPMLLSMKRISPGDTNTWFIRIRGTAMSAEFSTKYPKTLRTLSYTPGGPQAWLTEDLGYETAYPTISGHIFEFSFSDALLQMWAAFVDELAHGREGMRQPFYCATPEETALHHRVMSAGLESHKDGGVAYL